MKKEGRRGISLLKKSKRGALRIVFSRAGLLLLLMLVELALFITVLVRAAEAWPPVFGGTLLISLMMALYLLNLRMDPTAKITWLLVIMLFPVLGAVLFLYTRSDIGHRLLRRHTAAMAARSKARLPDDYPAARAFAAADARAAAITTYLRQSGCYPVFAGTEVTYFSSGEEKFEALLRELERAERFIFLEYFIIAEGEMWGRVLEILSRKAAAGVDVRVMYDGTCAFTTLTQDYPRRLAALRIRCKVFAPVTPFVSTHYNYRDHRKIAVVDGRVAFTGGVNLADEYINRLPRFGHWKDAAIMLRGDAVNSFTLMFLDMWNLDEKNPPPDESFLCAEAVEGEGAEGFVVPYADCPLDEYKTGEYVYLDMLARAERSVFIMTPYLILDGEMESALKYAAQRGVDVRLILPGIPDKKMPYALAKTYYAALLDAGVRIYEYTPGFVHAKVFVCDGREAVVGTVNLDYRSFYHHFECAAYLYRAPCIAAIEQDVADTIAACRAVTASTLKKEKWTTRLLGLLMKGIAPLV